ncbi:hypothetical protein PUN28_018063 [Cardiocondyla obscurior]|uniref:Uncharacterized protein n=1 Tax=Cardiocondyla obscurior TaxID=286306 RepID=A0AAW2EIC0_9HYME
MRSLMREASSRANRRMHPRDTQSRCRHFGGARQLNHCYSVLFAELSADFPRIERNINLARLCEKVSARCLFSLRRWGPPLGGCKLTLRNNLVVNLAYNNAGVVSPCSLPFYTPSPVLPLGMPSLPVGAQPNRPSLPPVDVEEYLEAIYFIAYFIFRSLATQRRSPRNNPQPPSPRPTLTLTFSPLGLGVYILRLFMTRFYAPALTALIKFAALNNRGNDDDDDGDDYAPDKDLRVGADGIMRLSDASVSVTGSHNRIARDYFSGRKKLRVTGPYTLVRQARDVKTRKLPPSLREPRGFYDGNQERAKASLADEPGYHFFLLFFFSLSLSLLFLSHPQSFFFFSLYVLYKREIAHVRMLHLLC